MIASSCAGVGTAAASMHRTRDVPEPFVVHRARLLDIGPGPPQRTLRIVARDDARANFLYSPL
jgi:hypothetical protein